MRERHPSTQALHEKKFLRRNAESTATRDFPSERSIPLSTASSLFLSRGGSRCLSLQDSNKSLRYRLPACSVGWWLMAGAGLF
jgi:hypothetical protein